MLLKGILEGRERSLRPVESRYVQLVDRLGAGGGQASESTAMEGVLEAENGKLGGSRLSIVKARLDLLLGPPNAFTPLAPPVEHESSLVGELIRLGSRLRREDLVQPLGRDLQESVS